MKYNSVMNYKTVLLPKTVFGKVWAFECEGCGALIPDTLTGKETHDAFHAGLDRSLTIQLGLRSVDDR